MGDTGTDTGFLVNSIQQQVLPEQIGRTRNMWQIAVTDRPKLRLDLFPVRFCRVSPGRTWSARFRPVSTGTSAEGWQSG